MRNKTRGGEVGSRDDVNGTKANRTEYRWNGRGALGFTTFTFCNLV